MVRAASPAPIVRLSIVVPTSSRRYDVPFPELHSRRAQAERSLSQLLLALESSDPIGTEVILASDDDEAAALHVESVFANAISAQRLRVLRLERSRDPAVTRNQAVALARGHYLAFVDLGDWWHAERLRELEPHLGRARLIVDARDHAGQSSDWLRTFLSGNWSVPSSVVVQRSLFEEIGGFPERTLGSEQYEFLLRALLRLAESAETDRLVILRAGQIVNETGFPPGQTPPILQTVSRTLRGLRERISLLTVLRALPKRHRLLALRALLGQRRIEG
ncbi:MAG: glycosyltransferase [Bdellovibrionales bacterium]|nr:glycosyltransferase [Bdellovibrionales bacterium]